MSTSSEPPAEEILQRAWAEQRRIAQEEAETAEWRRRADRLRAAFARVKRFTHQALADELGRPPTERDFAEAYARHLLTLGQELTAQKELLNSGPEELTS